MHATYIGIKSYLTLSYAVFACKCVYNQDMLTSLNTKYISECSKDQENTAEEDGDAGGLGVF